MTTNILPTFYGLQCISGFWKQTVDMLES